MRLTGLSWSGCFDTSREAHPSMNSPGSPCAGPAGSHSQPCGSAPSRVLAEGGWCMPCPRGSLEVGSGLCIDMCNSSVTATLTMDVDAVVGGLTVASSRASGCSGAKVASLPHYPSPSLGWRSSGRSEGEFGCTSQVG